MAIDPTEITAIKQGCLIGSPQTVDKNKKAVPNRRSGNLHFRAVHREDIPARRLTRRLFSVQYGNQLPYSDENPGFVRAAS